MSIHDDTDFPTKKLVWPFKKWLKISKQAGSGLQYDQVVTQLLTWNDLNPKTTLRQS